MIPGPSTPHPKSTPAQGNRKQSASKEISGPPASWRDGDSNASTAEPRGTNNAPKESAGVVRNLLAAFNAAAEDRTNS